MKLVAIILITTCILASGVVSGVSQGSELKPGGWLSCQNGYHLDLKPGGKTVADWVCVKDTPGYQSLTQFVNSYVTASPTPTTTKTKGYIPFRLTTTTPQPLVITSTAASTSNTKIEGAIALMREAEQSKPVTQYTECLSKKTPDEAVTCLNTLINEVVAIKQKNAEAGSLLSGAKPTGRYPSAGLSKLRTVQLYQKYEIESNEYYLRVVAADIPISTDSASISSQISRARTYIQRGTADLRQMEALYPSLDPQQYSVTVQGTMTEKSGITQLSNLFGSFSAAFDAVEHHAKARTYLKNKQNRQGVSEAKNALADCYKAQSLGYPFDMSTMINDINNALRLLGYE